VLGVRVLVMLRRVTGFLGRVVGLLGRGCERVGENARVSIVDFGEDPPVFWCIDKRSVGWVALVNLRERRLLGAAGFGVLLLTVVFCVGLRNFGIEARILREIFKLGGGNVDVFDDLFGIIVRVRLRLFHLGFLVGFVIGKRLRNGFRVGDLHGRLVHGFKELGDVLIDFLLARKRVVVVVGRRRRKKDTGFHACRNNGGKGTITIRRCHLRNQVTQVLVSSRSYGRLRG